tara:strand:- start:1214 stop:1474 length:261 start_codon:yes stop_codon:yes gene_type:complete
MVVTKEQIKNCLSLPLREYVWSMQKQVAKTENRRLTARRLQMALVVDTGLDVSISMSEEILKEFALRPELHRDGNKKTIQEVQEED